METNLRLSSQLLKLWKKGKTNKKEKKSKCFTNHSKFEPMKQDSKQEKENEIKQKSEQNKQKELQKSKK